MFQDEDGGVDEIMEGTADDLGYRAKGGNIRREKTPLDLRRKRKVLILWCAGIIILVLVAIIIFGGGSNNFAGNLEAINARIDYMEKRLPQLDLKDMNKKIMSLEDQVKALSKSVARLNKKIAARPKTRSVTKKKAISQAKKRRFHKVRSGDTISGIARKYAISVSKLLRYNNFSKDQVIYPGQKLWVTSGR